MHQNFGTVSGQARFNTQVGMMPPASYAHQISQSMPTYQNQQVLDRRVLPQVQQMAMNGGLPCANYTHGLQPVQYYTNSYLLSPGQQNNQVARPHPQQMADSSSLSAEAAHRVTLPAQQMATSAGHASLGLLHWANQHQPTTAPSAPVSLQAQQRVGVHQTFEQFRAAPRASKTKRKQQQQQNNRLLGAASVAANRRNYHSQQTAMPGGYAPGDAYIAAHIAQQTAARQIGVPDFHAQPAEMLPVGTGNMWSGQPSMEPAGMTSIHSMRSSYLPQHTVGPPSGVPSGVKMVGAHIQSAIQPFGETQTNSQWVDFQTQPEPDTSVGLQLLQGRASGQIEHGGGRKRFGKQTAKSVSKYTKDNYSLDYLETVPISDDEDVCVITKAHIRHKRIKVEPHGGDYEKSRTEREDFHVNSVSPGFAHDSSMTASDNDSGIWSPSPIETNIEDIRTTETISSSGIHEFITINDELFTEINMLRGEENLHDTNTENNQRDDVYVDTGQLAELQNQGSRDENINTEAQHTAWLPPEGTDAINAIIIDDDDKDNRLDDTHVDPTHSSSSDNVSVSLEDGIISVTIYRPCESAENGTAGTM